MSVEHAQHNEALCEHLFDTKQWNDWVLTTAFYSAVHYVESRIFPYTWNEVTYENFERFYPNRTDSSRSNHECRIKLVQKHISKAHSAYKWLFEECRTARYSKYQFTEERANEARKKLAIVKSLCVAAQKPADIPKA